MKEKQTLAIEFADEELEALIVYHKSNSKSYKKLNRNATFLKDLDTVIAIIRAAKNTSELEYFGKLKYKKLSHDLSGLSNVRIGYNSKYRRLIFEEFNSGIRIKLIEINELYGDK